MAKKPECKKGCIYYDWKLKKCDYPDNKCAIDDIPFNEKPNKIKALITFITESNKHKIVSQK